MTSSRLTIISLIDMRLKEHRAKLAVANYLGPLLDPEDLSVEEKSLIYSSFMDRIRSDGAENLNQIYTAYLSTLHEWGVMCPHPQLYRMYGGFQRSDSPILPIDSPWFDCGLCMAAVINR